MLNKWQHYVFYLVYISKEQAMLSIPDMTIEGAITIILHESWELCQLHVGYQNSCYTLHDYTRAF